MSHIIKSADVKEFEEKHLEEHQRAVGEDGYTVLQRALLEHNILVLSKIYMNISFVQIGKFLDIDPRKAENIIGEMISENRIRAQLDQATSSIEFEAIVEAKGV